MTNFALLRTGTVSVTNGSRTVTGVSTSFALNSVAGGILNVNGVDAFIDTVESDTSLTLVEGWGGPTTADASYVIARLTSAATLIVNANDRAADILRRLAEIDGSLTDEPDAFGGSLSDRDAFDAESEGFTFAVIPSDGSSPQYYKRHTATSGTWLGPYSFQGSTGTGTRGPSGTLTIGTVTTGAAGTSATVTNSGTLQEAVFDIAIPRGDMGETGPTGLAGAQTPGFAPVTNLLGSDVGFAIAGGKFASRKADGTVDSGDVSDYLTSPTTLKGLGADGIIRSGALNTPVYEHDLVGFEPPALLLPAQRENRVTGSGDLSTGWAERGGATKANSGVASPLNGVNFQTITSQGGSSDWAFNLVIAANALQTHSVYAARGNQANAALRVQALGGAGNELAQIAYNFDTEEVTSTSTGGSVLHDAKAVRVTSGVVRLILTFTPSNGATSGQVLVHRPIANAGDTALYAGYQAEYGYGASPYIATTNAAVTRTASLVTVPAADMPDFAATKQGTLFFDGVLMHGPSNAGLNPLIELGVPPSDRVQFWNWGGGPENIYPYVFVDGVNIAETGAAASNVLGVRTKAAIRWSEHAQSLRMFANGAGQAERSLTTAPDLTNALLRLGAINQSGQKTYAAMATTRAFSDNELEALTAL
ncbi:MAG: hypothetical protein AAGG69_00600 [Pseudomonadota bacterium]